MSLIFCACGCGGQLDEFDGWGRKRKYFRGHSSKGKCASEKTIRKMSEVRTGVPNLGNRGKIHTIKQNQIHSNCMKGKYSGENHWNWQGGIYPLNDQIRHCEQYSNWRTQIFGRDNFTCRECGQRGSWLEAHHIKEFAKILKENNITTFEAALNCSELWDLDNGITLCKQCHVIKSTGNIKRDCDT